MKVVAFDALSPQQWDAACRASGWAWLFHQHAWVTLEDRCFGHRNRSFALVDQESVVGVFPLYVSENGIGWIERLLHSGIHRHTGLALVDGLPALKVTEAWPAAMSQVMAVAADERVDRIQLNSQNLSPFNLGSRREEVPAWVRDYGFELGLNFGPNGMLPVPGMSTCCADQIVDLAGEEPALFDRLDPNCRKAVRKAQTSGVVFEESYADDELTVYRSLAQLAAERTGEQLPRDEYFEVLRRQLKPLGQIATLYASHGGAPVAAVLLAIDKGAVSYLGGVSHPEYLPMRVNDFLHWSAMRWARSRGHRYYRFGPVFPEVPDDWPIAKVSAFKKKFGARSVTTIQGSKFLKPEKYLDGGIAHLSRLCAPEASIG